MTGLVAEAPDVLRLVCSGCSETLPVRGPVSRGSLLRVMRAWAAEHRHVEASADEAERAYLTRRAAVDVL